jgi:hypothetical protein
MNEHVRRVVREHARFGELLRAAMPIRAGDALFHLDGDIVRHPDSHTIQVGEAAHLTTRGAWKAMNHACVPNVRIDLGERLMVAIRDIAAGEELCFNYNTTEWDMAAPFTCGCGHRDCVGTIRGFRYLDRAQRLRIASLLSPFIAGRLERFDR